MNLLFITHTSLEQIEEGLSLAPKFDRDLLRPILTTSLTTVIGLLPLAFSDPKWLPFCMAIIFGLMSSTLIAFFVVSGLYLQLTNRVNIQAD